MPKFQKYAVLLVLNSLVDWALTCFVLRHESGEYMPIARSCLDTGGPVLLAAYKLLVSAAIIFICYKFRLVRTLYMICISMWIVCVVMFSLASLIWFLT
jgi:hypothetical protein